MRARDAERYARLALEVAKRAGAVALEGYRNGTPIQRKGGTELVTRFDFLSEEVVREGLHAGAPEVAVIAEEKGGEASGDRVWYADPIDGTTNFAHGHPFWAVSIGLVVRGVPIAGAVVAPVLGLEWLAWMGGPALRNGQPCEVSAVGKLSDALLATGFPYDRQTNPDNNVEAFAALQKKAVGIRRCGSAAIDLCLVADGTYEGYWERSLRPWDIAAGIAVARAAGAKVSSFHGDAPDLAHGHVVASNGHIHAALVKELRKVRRLSASGRQ